MGYLYFRQRQSTINFSAQDLRSELLQMNRPQYVVCALYKFTALDRYAALQGLILNKLQESEMFGTILLASEGINGTVTGTRVAVDGFLDWLGRLPGLADIETKQSGSRQRPFKRARVKLKKEIVTMGVPGIDPRKSAGTCVDPKDWNALLEAPDVLVIDTRNEYEIKVGQFANAINPHTTRFREFPAFAKNHLDCKKHRRIAMYCTGGIRCEKSTAFLKQQGFNEVYQLKGGILKYLERVPQSESRWRGECFVFDDRVTVDHQLQKGSYDQCHACRLPISDADKRSGKYESGVSCPACFDQRTPRDKQRYAERERQFRLAEERGGRHIGPRKR